MWIGGEIVNPKLDYVLLFRDNSILDTVALDKNNFFMFKVENAKKSLYSFRHLEYQIFYGEPGDSLLLRVNTMEFDESLSYTGRGAEKNNLLMELFLSNEKERQIISNWYDLSPAAYNDKLDSLKNNRKEAYNEFVTNYKPSKEFKEIASASIDYANNLNKELYITTNFKKFQNDEKHYPKDFFKYRDKINHGNKSLQSYYPYYRFIDRYADNLAYEKYFNTKSIDRNSFVHNYYKIKFLDSLITNDSLKNNMLKSVVSVFLVRGQDTDKAGELVSTYKELCNNEEYVFEVQKLYQATNKLTVGNKIPNVLVLNAENTMKDLHSIIRKPSVLYFWSSHSIKHFQNIHIKAAELKAKYPEYDFIGLNTDTHFKKWRSIVLNSKYDSTLEFQFDDIDDATKKLIISSANKAMIIDRNGNIVSGNTSLFNPAIETILLGQLNKSTSKSQ